MKTFTLRMVGLLLVFVYCVGCENDSERVSPPSSDRSTAGPCDYPSSSEPGVTEGPIVDPVGPVLRERTRDPGALIDAYVFELINQSSEPIRLEGVELMPEDNASELRFEGAFVAPPSDALEYVRAGKRQEELTPVDSFCLPPQDSAGNPVLVLRIGPALPDQADGFRLSRNNNVNLFYRTSDGQSHTAVFPYRIQYPN